jgi:hypothetical protein
VDIDKENLKKLHNRHLDISTYEYDAETVLVEGRLSDERLRQAYDFNDKYHPPGIIHDLVVFMRVHRVKMTIVDIQSEMLTVPQPQCKEVEDSLKPLRGMKINAGFTERVRAAVGGKQGCTHLVALLLAMAPVTIQGIFATIGEKPADPALFSEPILKVLKDTCWTWRSDGELIKEMRKKKEKVSTS